MKIVTCKKNKKETKRVKNGIHRSSKTPSVNIENLTDVNLKCPQSSYFWSQYPDRTCDTSGYPRRSLPMIKQAGRCPVASITKPRKNTVVSSSRDFFRPIASLTNPANTAETRWPSTQLLASKIIKKLWCFLWKLTPYLSSFPPPVWHGSHQRRRRVLGWRCLLWSSSRARDSGCPESRKDI